MKIKTQDLTGSVLDWAVAKCRGLEIYFDDGVVCLKGQPFDDNSHYWLPTQNWAQGGPIIEREGIELFRNNEKDYWFTSKTRGGAYGTGSTPLIAAMRCYVASKLGDEIEVPEELK